MLLAVMKKCLNYIVVLLCICAVSKAVYASPDSDHYYIPPTQFNAALQIMDLGFANIFGLFRSATGSFEFEESTKSITNLRLALDSTSLIANNNNNEHDIMTLIGAAQYPEIRFTALDNVSIAEGKADIKGTLTMHGVSKPVTFSATLNRLGKSPNGGSLWASEGEAVGLSLRGSFKRADFGMTDDPEIPARFGDTITLLLEAQAIKQ